MIVIEIPPNPNCAATERVFHDVEPPKAVTKVRLERVPNEPQWCLVTGWTLQNTPCPATARKVDDSGEGVVFLIAGGEAGLRLQPTHQPRPWRIDDPHQWGVPFLLLADRADVRS